MASRVQLYQFTNSGNPISEHGAALQLGPDEKIYVANRLDTTLHRIESPNLPGTASNFVPDAINLSPNSSGYGLPNFISSFFSSAFAVSNAPLCQGDSLRLDVGGNFGGLTSISFAWTGPNGFAASVQAPTIPNVSPQDSGLYFLTVISNNNGLPDTIQDSIRVGLHPPAPQAVLQAGYHAVPGRFPHFAISGSVGWGSVVV